MRVLRSTADFIDLASRNACSAALVRALRDGTYTPPVKRKFPWGNYGWTFEVLNGRGSKWAVTIELLEAERKYRVRSHKVI